MNSLYCKVETICLRENLYLEGPIGLRLMWFEHCPDSNGLSFIMIFPCA
jgi:hypothetical protein